MEDALTHRKRLLHRGLFHLALMLTGPECAQAFEKSVLPLIEASCIECHDADTKTPLNLEVLEYDLQNPEVFRQWEKAEHEK